MAVHRTATVTPAGVWLSTSQHVPGSPESSSFRKELNLHSRAISLEGIRAVVGSVPRETGCFPKILSLTPHVTPGFIDGNTPCSVLQLAPSRAKQEFHISAPKPSLPTLRTPRLGKQEAGILLLRVDQSDSLRYV